MVEDIAVLVRAKNLVIGCRVSAARAVRQVKKGGEGHLVTLDKEALVCWDEGALLDAAVGKHERRIPLPSLQVLESTMCAGKNKEEVEDVVPLPDGREWTTTTDDMRGLALTNMVLGSLYQVYATRSAGPVQVMVEKEEGESDVHD